MSSFGADIFNLAYILVLQNTDNNLIVNLVMDNFFEMTPYSQ